jgi:hypothetical protein
MALRSEGPLSTPERASGLGYHLFNFDEGFDPRHLVELYG